MSVDGWIKLHRKLSETELWLSEPFTRGQAWVDLLMSANHKPGAIRKRGIMVYVDRGQVGYAEDTLAERWQWSRGKVRRFLKELENECQITHSISEKTVQKNSSVSSLITIVNYDKYQLDDTEDDTEDGRKTDGRRYSNKNEKNVNNNNTSSPEQFISIPIQRDLEYPIFYSMVEEWKNLYPKVDVEQQLREIRGWNLSHTTKRKTKAGILKHITSWLSREQNKLGADNGNTQPPSRPAIKLLGYMACSSCGKSTLEVNLFGGLCPDCLRSQNGERPIHNQSNAQ